jgi:hypothetical protein
MCTYLPLYYPFTPLDAILNPLSQPSTPFMKTINPSYPNQAPLLPLQLEEPTNTKEPNHLLTNRQHHHRRLTYPQAGPTQLLGQRNPNPPIPRQRSVQFMRIRLRSVAVGPVFLYPISLRNPSQTVSSVPLPLPTDSNPFAPLLPSRAARHGFAQMDGSCYMLRHLHADSQPHHHPRIPCRNARHRAENRKSAYIRKPLTNPRNRLSDLQLRVREPLHPHQRLEVPRWGGREQAELRAMIREMGATDGGGGVGNGIEVGDLKEGPQGP